MDKLSHHPCHRLSVPAAKLFWCRHCKEKFEDAISRWRHSKTCKIEGILNMNKRKEQEAEAFKLFVESTTESEIKNELESLPQSVALISPPEKVPNHTQQTGTDLNCYICKKEFTSLDEMRAHVRTPCNKQDRNSEIYNTFPFITEPSKDVRLVTSEQFLPPKTFESLFSLQNNKTLQKVKTEVNTVVVNNQLDTKRKTTHQETNSEEKMYENGISMLVDSTDYLKYHNTNGHSAMIVQANENEVSCCIKKEAEKSTVLKHVTTQDNNVKKTNNDNLCLVSEDIGTEVTDFNSSVSNVSLPTVDHSNISQALEVKPNLEQLETDVHAQFSMDQTESFTWKAFHAVNAVSDSNSEHEEVLTEHVKKKYDQDFTVVVTPPAVSANERNEEKTCDSVRKFKSTKGSKNKPKPTRAVIPVLHTSQRFTDEDDREDDCTEISDNSYKTYPPSPAQTRSKLKDLESQMRSTARRVKPTQKKLEMMVEQKSKSKLESNAKKKNVTKDEITSKKSVKKSEKQPLRKGSSVKESKTADKKTKPEKNVMFHELKSEKSKNKAPKNLKCRLCDKVFDSVKQYINHTRIPCKMKITRKWSQKVLRPNRSVPPAWKPRPGKRKLRDLKKVNPIQTQRCQKIPRTKFRPATPQLSITESFKEKQLLPQHETDVKKLTEKQLFFYKLGLTCSDHFLLKNPNGYIKPNDQLFTVHTGSISNNEDIPVTAFGEKGCSFVKEGKETSDEISQYNTVNSPNILLNSKNVNHSTPEKHLTLSPSTPASSNVYSGTEASLNSKEQYSVPKITATGFVKSPQKKEDRNLFETLGREMISKKQPVSLSRTNITSLPQRLAEQTNKDIFGFLSKSFGIESLDDSFLKNIKENDNQHISPLKSAIKKNLGSLVLSSHEISQNSRHVPGYSHPSMHHSPSVLIPSPMRLLAPHFISPQCSSKKGIVSQEQNIRASGSESNINHAVRKLHFNSSQTFTDTKQNNCFITCKTSVLDNPVTNNCHKNNKCTFEKDNVKCIPSAENRNSLGNDETSHRLSKAENAFCSNKQSCLKAENESNKVNHSGDSALNAACTLPSQVNHCNGICMSDQGSTSAEDTRSTDTLNTDADTPTLKTNCSDIEVCMLESSDEIMVGDESQNMIVDDEMPEVTVEIVDHITSDMLDDTQDVTYIIIERDDVKQYIDSLEEITNATDSVVKCNDTEETANTLIQIHSYLLDDRTKCS